MCKLLTNDIQKYFPNTLFHRMRKQIKFAIWSTFERDYCAFDRVDYVDKFGRSRRCLRKDLPEMISDGQKTVNSTK